MTSGTTTRRGLLRTAGRASLAGLASLLCPVPRCSRQNWAFAAPRSKVLSPQEFKTQLAGPILSLPTTFRADLSVNYQAVHKMIGRAIRFGVPIFGLTAGNSKYRMLTYDEIKGMTKTMVEATDSQGLTIAATGAWSTEQVLDYARFSEAVGADALQILLPKDVTAEDALFQHFKTIADGTRLPLVLHGRFSSSLLTRLAAIESIVAMKEDLQLTYYIDRAIMFGDRFEIFSGGAENRYLVGYPYGSKAFFATYTGFAPDKPMLFWKAIRSGNIQQAVEITKKYDHPFIQRFSHPFWHATLEHFRVAERYMRKPFKTFTVEQMREVQAFFDGQGINPDQYESA